MAKNNINLKISYSIEFEIRRVLYTLKEYDWYIKNGYRINLPNGIDLNNLNKITKNHIKKLICKEYNRDSYRNMGNFIKKSWDKDKKVIDNLLKSKLKLQPVYLIFLTKYGTGGSYYLPNHITLNFKIMLKSLLTRVLLHEIIHLSIEEFIIEYKIGHWEKERIVDLFMRKINPSIKEMQKIKYDTEKIDRIFNQFFPDIEKIVQNI
ncbi:MAG: hypothetical protein ABIC36_01035 [bacterium]